MPLQTPNATKVKAIENIFVVQGIMIGLKICGKPIDIMRSMTPPSMFRDQLFNVDLVLCLEEENTVSTKRFFWQLVGACRELAITLFSFDMQNSFNVPCGSKPSKLKGKLVCTSEILSCFQKTLHAQEQNGGLSSIEIKIADLNILWKKCLQGFPNSMLTHTVFLTHAKNYCNWIPGRIFGRNYGHNCRAVNVCCELHLNGTFPTIDVYSKVWSSSHNISRKNSMFS